MLKSIHSIHAAGEITNETSATAAVTPTPIANVRHSRRKKNQSSPTPAVSFVRIGTAYHAGDQAGEGRIAKTIAAAIGIVMLPSRTAPRPAPRTFSAGNAIATNPRAIARSVHSRRQTHSDAKHSR